MPPPAAAPTLPEELLEEIFLRLPPDEPEWLVRASLASKLWLGRLSGPRFRGRYSEFHRAAPMLGFFYSDPRIKEEPPFVSTTKFRVRIPDSANTRYFAYDALDCRHGRALLSGLPPKELAVLDPITGCRRDLDLPECYKGYGAAVLCAVNGCDHRACHGGPSRVVFVGLGSDAAYAYESLLEKGERSKPHSRLGRWSEPSAGLHLGPRAYIKLVPVPPVLIQDALYFKLTYNDDAHVGILKYDLCSKCLSLIDVQEDIAYSTILMGMEDGSLGFAHLDGLSLNLWSRQIGSGGVGSWIKCRVIDLDELLPVPKERLRLIGYVEGGDIIFMTMKLGIYEINLKTLEWKKIWKNEDICTLVPYMSFYYPRGKVNPCDVEQ